MSESKSDWKNALKAEDKFRQFIINYFAEHEALTGSYDIPSYYEPYVVKLDKQRKNCDCLNHWNESSWR